MWQRITPRWKYYLIFPTDHIKEARTDEWYADKRKMQIYSNVFDFLHS